MIEPKLYCIEAMYADDEEPYSFHVVGVDMDQKTAQLLASKELDLPKKYISILAYYKVTVDGFDITLTEKEEEK